MNKNSLMVWDLNIHYYCIHLSRFQTSKQCLEALLYSDEMQNVNVNLLIRAHRLMSTAQNARIYITFCVLSK